MKKVDRRDLWMVLVLVVLWALFSWRFVTPNPSDRVSFPEGDFSHHFLVYRSYAYRELKAGRFPLWMDCTFVGYPFQADPQSALFYLPAMANLGLHLLLGVDAFPSFSLQLEALLHLLLASGLTYVFLRDGGFRPLSALCGALIFSYGGYLTGYPPLQIAILEGAVWLPIALWGARGCARGRFPLARAGSMVGALVLSVFAGSPQTTLYVGYATVGYAVYQMWRCRLPWRVALGRLALIGLAVGGICAVQLLPTIQYTQLSTRAEMSFARAGSGLPLRDIVQVLLPGVVSLWHPFYVGILPLALAVLGALNDELRGRVFWVGLVSVGLLLSFGRYVFGFDLAYLIAPGYGLFRQQERHALWVSFGASVLAAGGLELLLAPLSRSNREALRGIARLAGGLGGGALGLLLLATLASRTGAVDVGPGLMDRVGLLALLLGGTWALLYARGRLARHQMAYLPAGDRHRMARRRWGVAAAMVGFVVVDLFTINRPVNYGPVRDPFPPERALAASIADDDPFFRIQEDGRLPGHTVCMHGLEETRGITPIKPQKVAAFEQVPEEVRWPLLGVRYVVTWRGALERADGTSIPSEQVYADHENAIYTYRLPGDTPVAWVAHRVEVVDDRQAVYDLLADPSFDPYAQVVTRDEEASPSSGSGTGSVSLLKRTPLEVQLHVENSAPGVLVLSQTHYPGWRAVVDGERARVFEVDALLPAVEVPAGEFDVTFRYRPVTFYVGLAISLVTLAFGSAWLALAWSRKGA